MVLQLSDYSHARRDIDEGLLPSAQVALAINGEIVVEETFGAATPSRVTASSHLLRHSSQAVVGF